MWPKNILEKKIQSDEFPQTTVMVGIGYKIHNFIGQNVSYNFSEC